MLIKIDVIMKINSACALSNVESPYDKTCFLGIGDNLVDRYDQSDNLYLKSC